MNNENKKECCIRVSESSARMFCNRLRKKNNVSHEKIINCHKTTSDTNIIYNFRYSSRNRVSARVNVRKFPPLQKQQKNH